MKLYGHPLSGNAHRVQNMLGILRIPHENVIVDLTVGAHKLPDFLAMNPLGQVPVLIDDDLTLRDSTAILPYLARKYDATNRWLPTDAIGNAHVQEWLSIAVNEIMQGPFVVRAIKMFAMPADLNAAKAKTDDLFDALFEPHLKDRQWLAGDHATIADIACYSYIARVTDGEYSLDAYPAIRAWLTRVEDLDGFAPFVVGADFLASLNA
ncbi:glutathione S-transferase N-terminal domain-containing protein [Pseudosulfitobacter sp. SM2401]|uniref:glutathione S-transferase family protein n=1 Tax=Pseudosulfitobacter sp. SM2401 TaxID=3350098 RepID=UPI0036F3D902